MLDPTFFDQTPLELARALLGKVLRHRVGALTLSAQIIETEAYYKRERGSHASLGRTPSREALFMPPGTIYMYYARGGDSLNFSARGAGNAVLIKSGYPFFDDRAAELARMQQLNPNADGSPRPENKLCKGQTLLCRSLGLRVVDWNQQQLTEAFCVEDAGYAPARWIRARRLGIPDGRDEHLQYRFVDYDFAAHCTSNPLTKRAWKAGVDFYVISRPRPADHSG